MATEATKLTPDQESQAGANRWRRAIAATMSICGKARSITTCSTRSLST